MINLNIDTFCLSSSLPNKFTIGQMDDSILCEVYLDDTLIYSTTLFSNDRTVTFYDLRTLVEEYMRSHQMVHCTFSICVETGHGSEQVDDITIVYCPFQHGMDSDIDFLESHFLTSRRVCSVPRGYPANLAFFASNQEPFTIEVNCMFRLNGVLNPCCYQEVVPLQSRPSKYSFRMDSQYVTRQCEIVDGDEVGELMSASVSVGNRHITFFYTDEIPSVSFTFRNTFNILEYMHVIGKEVLKTEIDRKEAVCQGSTSFYDESIERKHVVETCHLSPEEARWFNEFLYSKFIVVVLQQDELHIPVVISDVTSEINYSPEEQTRIKFAWNFSDNREWHDVIRPAQVFNNNYNPIFQ